MVFERVNVLGVGISVLNLQTALEAISWKSIASRRKGYICVTGVHGVMRKRKRAEVLRRY